VVLHYLQARGYDAAAASLSSSLPPGSSPPGALAAAPPSSSLSSLSPQSYLLDVSTDLVFWGLAAGDPRRLKDAFGLFFSMVLSHEPHADVPGPPSAHGVTSVTPPAARSTPLLGLSFVVFAHVYASLLSQSFPEHAAALLASYSPRFTPSFEQELSSLRQCTDPKDLHALQSSLLEASRLRSSLLSVRAELKSLARASLSAGSAPLPPAPGAFAPSREPRLRELDLQAQAALSRQSELRAALAEAAGGLRKLPFLGRLVSLRSHAPLSPASYARLSGILGEPALAPIASIVASRTIVVVDPGVDDSLVPPVVLEDQLDPCTSASPSPLPPPPAVSWAAPFPSHLRSLLGHSQLPSASLPYPDFADPSYNAPLLAGGFRKLAAIERGLQGAGKAPQKIQACEVRRGGERAERHTRKGFDDDI
jgi:hypothetical protein